MAEKGKNIVRIRHYNALQKRLRDREKGVCYAKDYFNTDYLPTLFEYSIVFKDKDGIRVCPTPDTKLHGSTKDITLKAFAIYCVRDTKYISSLKLAREVESYWNQFMN